MEAVAGHVHILGGSVGGVDESITHEITTWKHIIFPSMLK